MLKPRIKFANLADFGGVYGGGGGAVKSSGNMLAIMARCKLDTVLRFFLFAVSSNTLQHWSVVRLRPIWGSNLVSHGMFLLNLLHYLGCMHSVALICRVNTDIISQKAGFCSQNHIYIIKSTIKITFLWVYGSRKYLFSSSKQLFTNVLKICVNILYKIIINMNLTLGWYFN